MKALVLKSADGPASASLEEVETPTPSPGEVAVRVQGASLNHRELWISRGLYPGMALPTVLGADGAGTVVGVGDGLDWGLVGKEVVLYPGLGWGNSERFPAPGFGLLGMPGPGTIAETICVPAENAVSKPAHLSFVEAAALPVAALTAYRALNVKGGLSAGQRVLVTGVGGGVATFGLLFAKAMGATVYVTSGSDETLQKARDLGAADGFNYRDEQWGKKLRAAAGAIDVVLDGAPAAGFAQYARSLAIGARVVLYGSTGGAAFSANAPDLFLRHASIVGTAMGSPADFSDMLRLVETHGIRPVIDRQFAFQDAHGALLHLEKGHAFGKVVIDIGPR
jgi:zinc-binding alcohol dehydrogenase/oxidoreductase